MTREKFVYVIFIASTVDKVWQALIEGDLTRIYWRHLQLSDWTVGASWELVSADAERTVRCQGKVLEFVPNHRLAVTWAEPADDADESRHSHLLVELEAVGTMVRLAITHDNLTPELQGKVSAGWPRVLSSLKSFLETGQALDVMACQTGS